MAVAYDNSLTAKNGTNNMAWSSGNLAVGTLTNAGAFLLFCWANTAGTARTVSTVKLDSSGSSFTLFNGVSGSMGASRPEAGVALYYLTGAALTNANHTVDVVMSGATRWKAGLFLTAQGVDQATPMAGFASDIVDVTSPSAMSPAGGTANDLMVAGLLDFDGAGTATMGVIAGTTQRGTTQTDTSVFGLNFIAGTAAGSAASTGFTWSAATSNMEIAALIKATSGVAFMPKGGPYLNQAVNRAGTY